MENEREDAKENKIILLTIKNVVYPINTDVIYRVASLSGTVEKIVIFKKKFLQAMVEYVDLESAKKAKESLQDKDMYDGCNTIKVEYARTQKLNVYKNDNETWDYTRNEFKKSSGLLGERPEPYHPGAPGDSPKGAYSYAPGHPALGPHGGSHGYDQNNGGPRNWNRDRAAGIQKGGKKGDETNRNSIEQSSVLMVYGLNLEKLNCDKLFNLLCLYGNVLKIKFLKTKSNTAMAQMCTPGAVDRACQWLNGIKLYSLELSLSKSKQLHLVDSNQSKFMLPDNSQSFVDYSNSRNHRFTSQKMAKMNRLQKPNKILHYFNAPAKFTEQQIKQLCSEQIDCEPQVKVFPPRDEFSKTSSGLLEFQSIHEAVVALIQLNHHEVETEESSSRTLKLCFSSSRQ